ncbi:MAG: hypothetical protein PUE85_02670 [Firmicutes bacterium]|nr:hypothetical protein [Bacillota bacterium]
MISYSKYFSCEEEKADYVKECEESFRERLQSVACDTVNTKDLKIITLSGPTCSGKTTTAGTLIRTLNEAGMKVKVISIDDFYRNRAELNHEAQLQNRPVDLDSVSSIDLVELGKVVSAILDGKTVQIPVYDFKTGTRKDGGELRTKEYNVFLFEGIQAVYPEVISLFGGHPHRSIFISVEDDINVNGQFFSRRDIRFLRRLVRDYRFRNTSPDQTFEHWEGVVANEKKSIDPYSGGADVHISSFMPYEPFMLKIPALELITRIPRDDRHFIEAASLASRFAGLSAITPHYLPDDSVYHEFLG